MPIQLPQQPLSAEIRHNLFLAFKEALTNVLKHAKASEVRISITLVESGFAFVEDDVALRSIYAEWLKQAGGFRLLSQFGDGLQALETLP